MGAPRVPVEQLRDQELVVLEAPGAGVEHDPAGSRPLRNPVDVQAFRTTRGTARDGRQGRHRGGGLRSLDAVGVVRGGLRSLRGLVLPGSRGAGARHLGDSGDRGMLEHLAHDEVPGPVLQAWHLPAHTGDGLGHEQRIAAGGVEVLLATDLGDLENLFPDLRDPALRTVKRLDCPRGLDGAPGLAGLSESPAVDFPVRTQRQLIHDPHRCGNHVARQIGPHVGEQVVLIDREGSRPGRASGGSGTNRAGRGSGVGGVADDDQALAALAQRIPFTRVVGQAAQASRLVHTVPLSILDEHLMRISAMVGERDQAHLDEDRDEGRVELDDRLDHHDHTASAPQLIEPGEGLLNVHRIVQHVGADDDVIGARLNVLGGAVHVHVEQAVGHEVAVPIGLPGIAQEEGRDVGEPVLDHVARQAPDDVLGGRADARAHLEDPHRTVTAGCGDPDHGLGDRGVDRLADPVPSVGGTGVLGIALGEEQVDGVDLAAQLAQQGLRRMPLVGEEYGAVADSVLQLFEPVPALLDAEPFQSLPGDGIPPGVGGDEPLGDQDLQPAPHEAAVLVVGGDPLGDLRQVMAPAGHQEHPGPLECRQQRSQGCLIAGARPLGDGR